MTKKRSGTGTRATGTAAQDDGARYSLAGYFYQAVGAGALAATIHGLDVNNGIGLTISVVDDGKISYERFGQDAVIDGTVCKSGENRRTFVQFKFSSTPAEHPIKAADLLKIARTFKNSRDSADSQDAIESDFVLISNRKHDSEVDEMLEASRTGTGHTKLGTPTQRKSERAVLARMRVILKSEANLKSEIEKYARNRGVFNRELRDGLNRMVGELNSLAGSSIETLDIPWLNGVLAGCELLCEINPSALFTDLANALETFGRSTNVPEQPVFRRTEELRKLFVESPVVVVCGHGGCGKTVAVHQAANLQLGTLATAGYAAAIDARHLTPNYLPSLVQMWRGGHPELPRDSDGEALARLELAQQGTDRPVLVIGIDAIDESVNAGNTDWQSIEKLLDFAWTTFSLNPGEQPKLAVIVSCRTESELEHIWTRYEDPTIRTRVPTVSLDTFSDDDLIELGKSQPNALAERLASSISFRRIAARMPLRSAQQVDDFEGDSVSPISNTLLHALSHPVMWGCFAALSEQHRREIILNESKVSLSELAGHFLERFQKKVRRRHRANFAQLKVIRLLSLVAQAQSTDEDAASRQSWFKAATAQGEFMLHEANALFDESLSAGVIQQEDRNQWRWRHPFVRDFLLATDL